MITRYFIRSEADKKSAAISAEQFSREKGFSQSEQRKVATVISELAANITKHTNGMGGEVSFRHIVNTDKSEAIIITAIDNGPGIADIDMALKDHFSTAGTLGLGLPAVRRLCDELEIQSALGEGSVVRASILKNHGTP